MKKDSTTGLEKLARLVGDGPDTVRSLIAAGDTDLALAQARWLKSVHHPQADCLIVEAERAVHTRQNVSH